MSNIEKFIAQGFFFELFPILIIGVLSGIANFCRKDSDEETEANWRDFFYQFSSSILICGIVYAILDSTNFSYMTRWAIAGAVSFYGVDKALEIAQKLLNLRNGGSNVSKDTTETKKVVEDEER